MSLSDKTSGISELNSLPTLFLLEGPKFPSFDFKISPSNHLILSKFLEKQCNENKLDFKGKKVIELGAGKSIPSLTSSILGASMVTITDAPIVIPEIEKIIKLNGFENNNVLAKPLDWENRKDYIPFLIDKGPWDFILAADVIWVDYLIVPLVDSIDDNMLFDTLKKRGWKIQKVSRDELNLEEGFWKDNVDIYQGQKEQE
ncbi:11989_t:CDS:2 [Rhizophagus irregularis]|nr:11989_t:CDS:2 [Rhizophagus irregularis]